MSPRTPGWCSPLPEFWRSSGFPLLERDAAGRLRVTDDFLRAYYLRPELRPLEASCAAERALHAALMDEPRRPVAARELQALADPDARDNYRLVLKFRERLLAADSIEGCYLGLLRGGVDVPPLFVAQLAHVILHNILDGCGEPLRLRAAELFFREQKATLHEGEVLLADLETVQAHASGARYGGLGRLIVEAQGGIASANLPVLDAGNAALYWERESRHDTVISLSYGRAAPEALARVIEAWVAHFLALRVTVRPVPRIEDRDWTWHIGLDAESSAILNALWKGEAVEPGRLRRILALFLLDLAGRPVVLALAADENDLVRMKPQNLLLNLPLHEA